MKETLTIYEKKTMGRNIATRVILISVAIVATICLCSFLIWAINNDDDYVISIIHMNDFHDRFDELTWSLANCKTQNGSCIGGFARLYSAIDKLKKELPNPIVLNAGDNFEGSLWYKIFKWNVTQYFLNLLPIDVITLGNHEFDDGIAGVVPFMKGLKAPIALANVDDSLEPSFQNLYTKSVILTRNNKKIGIIGVLTKETKFLASPERLIFTDEIEAVRTEAERLKHEEKCQIIIVLSHCGKNADREIAKFGGKYIHVIVGGHSHDLYYSGENPPGPDKVAASYPDIVLQANERKVLIVQSSWASKYLGHLTIYFTKNNEIDRWEGNSEFLDHNWPQNKTINSLLTPWRDIIEEKAELVLGSTLTKLDQSDCFKGECTAGDFITDAILEEWKLKAEPEDEWSYASVVIMNSGGIRSSIDEGRVYKLSNTLN